MDTPRQLGSSAQALPLDGRRVLVVDDDEDIRTFILTLLADAGARVGEAATGEEALRKAAENPPDLITLDLSLPGADGGEVFRALRSDPATEEVPVCIVTGHPEMRSLIYDRSATAPEGFVTKPFDGDDLIATVRRIIWMSGRPRPDSGRAV